MIRITRFNDAPDDDRGDVPIGKGAVVSDVHDARAFIRHQRGELRQPSRSVADRGGEPAKAAIGCQAPFQNAAEDSRIYVAAAKRQHHLATGQFGNQARQTSRQRRGARTLHHRFFQFNQSQNSQGNIPLRDDDRAVYILTRDFKRIFPTQETAKPSARVGLTVTGTGPPAFSEAT